MPSNISLGVFHGRPRREFIKFYLRLDSPPFNGARFVSGNDWLRSGVCVCVIGVIEPLRRAANFALRRWDLEVGVVIVWY